VSIELVINVCYSSAALEILGECSCIAFSRSPRVQNSSCLTKNLPCSVAWLPTKTSWCSRISALVNFLSCKTYTSIRTAYSGRVQNNWL